MSYPYHFTQYSPLYPDPYMPSAPPQEMSAFQEPFQPSTYSTPMYNPSSQAGFTPAPMLQVPILTQAMHSATHQLLDKAQELASSIFSSNASTHFQTTQVPQPRMHHLPTRPLYFDFSRREYHVFSSRNENHYHRSDKEQKEESGIRIVAVVAGLIVAGVSAYFLGKAVAQNEDEQENNMNFQALKECWQRHKATYRAQDEELVHFIDNIVDKTDAILSRQQTNRTHKIAMFALFFLGGSMAVAGGLMGSSLLMGTGLVIGAAVGIFALYKLGYHYSSKRDIKDAQVIHAHLAHVVERQALLQVGF